MNFDDTNFRGCQAYTEAIVLELINLRGGRYFVSRSSSPPFPKLGIAENITRTIYEKRSKSKLKKIGFVFHVRPIDPLIYGTITVQIKRDYLSKKDLQSIIDKTR